MTTKTITDLDEYKIEERNLNGGTQTVYRFPNGFGASVIRGGWYAYGGLELAVLTFEDESNDYHLTYATPITDDVVGHLDDVSLLATLIKVHDLPEGATYDWDAHDNDSEDD